MHQFHDGVSGQWRSNLVVGARRQDDVWCPSPSPARHLYWSLMLIERAYVNVMESFC